MILLNLQLRCTINLIREMNSCGLCRVMQGMGSGMPCCDKLAVIKSVGSKDTSAT